MSGVQGVPDNPNAFDESSYESSEGNLEQVLRGTVDELWQAGGTPQDIVESVKQATIDVLRSI